MYGLSEVLVGVSVAVERTTATTASGASPLDTSFYLAMLTASVYLVVRGLDNIHQGFTNEPIDPIAARIVAWLAGPSTNQHEDTPTPTNAA